MPFRKLRLLLRSPIEASRLLAQLVQQLAMLVEGSKNQQSLVNDKLDKVIDRLDSRAETLDRSLARIVEGASTQQRLFNDIFEKAVARLETQSGMLDDKLEKIIEGSVNQQRILNDKFDAVVDLWGGGVVMPETNPKQPVAPIDYTKDLKAPLLGLFGNEDQRPSPADVDKHEEELKKQGKKYEFHRYDGAGHGFFYYDRPAYRQQQAMDGWAKVFTFFDANLR